MPAALEEAAHARTPPARFSPAVSYTLARLSNSAAMNLVGTVRTIYLRNAGLSFMAIGALDSIYLAVHSLLNVPTGVLADMRGRRLAYVIGLCAMASSYLLFGLDRVVGRTIDLFGLRSGLWIGIIVSPRSPSFRWRRVSLEANGRRRK